jgi:hypothetical protein
MSRAPKVTVWSSGVGAGWGSSTGQEGLNHRLKGLLPPATHASGTPAGQEEGDFVWARGVNQVEQAKYNLVDRIGVDQDSRGEDTGYEVAKRAHRRAKRRCIDDCG